MPHDRRTALRFGLAGAALGAFPFVHAQALPETARILIGYPPGGGIDMIARKLAEQLNGKLATTVLVDNRPGAAGRLAVDVAMQSPPDGTTLLLSPAGVLTINPHTYKKSNYDPFKDFTALSLAALIDFGFAVGPAVPAQVKTLADFTTWARANKGKVSFGSPAAGAPPHFVGDLLSSQLDLGLTHVPYRGGAPAMNDVMGGQIHALVLTLGDLIQHARAGRMRLLACTGPRRSQFAPEVPTFAEQGVKGLDMRDWFAAFIVGKPAPAVAAKTGALVREALGTPQYVRALVTAGIEPTSSTPQEVDQLVRDDHKRWGAIVKASGFTAEV